MKCMIINSKKCNQLRSRKKLTYRHVEINCGMENGKLKKKNVRKLKDWGNGEIAKQSNLKQENQVTK